MSASADPGPRPISGTTHLAGVIGWPVEHSLSPTIHNAAFAALGMDWAYVPLPVEPGRFASRSTGSRGSGSVAPT
jgi:shikimate dehydrogenase